jgi:gluconate kinase
MARERDSMNALLQLVEAPSMETEESEARSLKIQRQTPVENEQQVRWAIQDGDDVHSRLALPDWLSGPLQRRIADWVSENEKWNSKIAEREQQGKTLPPASQKKYDDFVEHRSVIKLLFSKDKKRLVNKVKNAADLKQLKPSLLSIELTMSETPENLRIRVGEGPSQRMILLRGQPTELDPEAVALLSEAGVLDSVAAAVLEVGEDEDEGQSGEEEAFEQEQKALEEREKEIASEAEEVLVLSDDEEDLEVLQLEISSFKRVKDFAHREAYRKLHDRGLAEVPPGCSIAYHKTSRQWQGYYAGRSCGLCHTHGGRAQRSEAECLFAVLLGLAEKHVAEKPRDRLWAVQLAKLEKFGLTEAKF